jgi:hypothetical protein
MTNHKMHFGLNIRVKRHEYPAKSPRRTALLMADQRITSCSQETEATRTFALHRPMSINARRIECPTNTQLQISFPINHRQCPAWAWIRSFPHRNPFRSDHPTISMPPTIMVTMTPRAIRLMRTCLRRLRSSLYRITGNLMYQSHPTQQTPTSLRLRTSRLHTPSRHPMSRQHTPRLRNPTASHTVK